MKDSLKKATLLFLRRDGEILLAMKKRGFGAGHWNGVGGKPDPGETIIDTAIRECQEEIGVTPLSLNHVATLDFLFAPDKALEGWNQQVWVYFCDRWEGEPSETEEMAPKWFKLDQIPYSQMWEDDQHWLPKVLGGDFVTAEFHFGDDQKLAEFTLNTKPLSN